MEKSAALVEKIMKRIALVEIHHQTGEWVNEKDFVFKKSEEKKTA